MKTRTHPQPPAFKTGQAPSRGELGVLIIENVQLKNLNKS